MGRGPDNRQSGPRFDGPIRPAPVAPKGILIDFQQAAVAQTPDSLQPIFPPIIPNTNLAPKHNPTAEPSLSAAREPGQEQQTKKEVLSPLHIAQFSMGIACLEEGMHIPRMMDTLATSPIPPATELFVAISDNGSRGAWKLIQPESSLTNQRHTLQDSLNDPEKVETFADILQQEAEARKAILQLAQANPQVDPTALLEEALTKRNNAVVALAQRIPDALQQQLFSYSLAEDMQRSLLQQALLQPRTFIEEADQQKPPLIPNQKPTRDQEDTIRAYAEILLGKYDNPSNNLRIAIVQGSETGSFGSVKRYALDAVKQDFAMHHPDKDPKGHIIMIGDMDTDIPRDFIKKTITAFEKNPKKTSLLAKPFLVAEEATPSGNKKLKRYRLVPHPIPTIFMDETNMRDFIHEEIPDQQRRNPEQFLPKGFGHIPRWKYHLHPGPALIFRGDVFENITIPTVDGQGEDIALSWRYQRKYGADNTIRDRSIEYGFNMRGHRLIDYIGEFARHPRATARAIKQGILRDRVVPYKHHQLEKVMEKDYIPFIEGREGYMKRHSLVLNLIREAEEEIFPQLQPYEFVIARSPNKKQLSGDRIYRGYNPITKKIEYAVIGTAPRDIAIREDEYVVGIVSGDQAKRIQEESGTKERVILGTQIVQKTDGTQVKEAHFYHIQRRLEDRTTTNIEIAETPATHVNHMQRAVSLPEESTSEK